MGANTVLGNQTTEDSTGKDLTLHVIECRETNSEKKNEPRK